MEVSVALALVAGLLSFLSPCVLALVPVYLAFLGEMAGSATDTAPGAVAGPPPRAAVLGPALAFVGGFSAFFIVLGISVGLVGQPLFRVPEIREAAGIGVILIGLLSTGIFGPVLDRWRVDVRADRLPATRGLRALALGGLVAIGWTPCIGPVLGAILSMGASSSEVGVAAILLVAYSVGLAIPFLAAALALPRLRGVMGFLRAHHRAVGIISGAFIMLVGVLILTNAFSRLAGIFFFAI